MTLGFMRLPWPHLISGALLGAFTWGIGRSNEFYIATIKVVGPEGVELSVDLCVADEGTIARDLSELLLPQTTGVLGVRRRLTRRPGSRRVTTHFGGLPLRRHPRAGLP